MLLVFTLHIYAQITPGQIFTAILDSICQIGLRRVTPNYVIHAIYTYLCKVRSRGGVAGVGWGEMANKYRIELLMYTLSI